MQDSHRQASGRKGWEGVSKAWVRVAGLGPPPLPGHSPAHGHGQGGLRWGLLEQLLELQQLLLLLLELLLELLLLELVEHGGWGGRRGSLGSPPQARPAVLRARSPVPTPALKYCP